jgi:pyruvate/2-oxoglutarate dehydrogenase complex dihydrolipoamide dehydrogenase (E3) component
VVHSAKVASYFHRREEFGIAAPNQPIDMIAVRERKRNMVNELVEMHLRNYKASGTELVMGQGTFVAPKTIQVQLNNGGTRTVRGKTVVIDTGSRARIEPTPGLSDARPLTHVEALELDRVPEHLLVLGGGYVGLEFAQAFRRLGSRVTIVDRNDALLHHEDADVSQAIEQLFKDEGIAIATGTVVHGVEGTSGKSVRLRVARGATDEVIEGTHLLVAGGRTPNIDGIGLETAGVETDSHGHIKVNERRETTAKDVLAVGDCAGGPYFTHIAENDFQIVRENLAGGNRTTTGRQVPFCLFIDPEMARIGLNEREAKARGIRYRLAKIPMSHVLRTYTLSEPRGFLKALVEANGEHILGFTALGVSAGELLPAVQVVMSAGLPYTVLRDTIIAHPTIAEGLNGLFTSPLFAPPA